MPGCGLDELPDHAMAAVPIESRSAIVLEGSCNVAAPRFSRRWLMEDVPGISSMFGER